MGSRVQLKKSLHDYSSDHTIESDFKLQFVQLLDHPRAFFRDHLPGHITASAFIVDATRKFTLLTHHAKLNRWLQPGGHADGEENVWLVAEKEAREETGLTSLKLLLSNLFDLDIHTIPARNEFPEHLHFDIRFLFEANNNERFTITDESQSLAWIPFGDISKVTDSNGSILRMTAKVRKLFGADEQ